jgi:hypothetical protein
LNQNLPVGHNELYGVLLLSNVPVSRTRCYNYYVTSTALESIPCRLCGAPAKVRFTLSVLQSYPVAYFECSGCRSLQTEAPYWLERAYVSDHLTLDVGRAQRNVINAMLLAHILQELQVSRQQSCLDWGAGEGLFSRLMRDRGFNFSPSDKHRQVLYSHPVEVQSPADPAVVTAFEVFEHLAEPARDLTAIFELKPRMVFASTECYEGQSEDWWYYAPFHGQHVFFYSREALNWIGGRFGYRYLALPSLHLFVEEAVWRNPDVEPMRHGVEHLVASAGSLYQEAVHSLAEHFLGDPWKYVHQDHILLLGSSAGS